MIKDQENFSFGVIGAGKLGLTISLELARLERLKWILARSNQSRQNVVDKFYHTAFIRRSIDEIEEIPNMIIIAVSDGSVEEVSNALAKQFGKRLKGKYVIHTSGVLNREVLYACKEAGASVAAVHPFQTFYYDSENIFRDIRWGIEAADEDYDLFSHFVTFLYGFPIRLTTDSIKEKALYHAMAVATSNYMTTIIQLAHKIADSANIDSKEFLPPIAKTTLGNNLRGLADKEAPLTGPIARGDINTLELHILAMKDKPQILKPYCLLGLATVEMAFNAKLIDGQIYSKIKHLLTQHINF